MMLAAAGRRRDERGGGAIARAISSKKNSSPGWTMTSVLGSWSILIASKFWEGTTGDATLRRVVMLIVGLGVGVSPTRPPTP